MTTVGQERAVANASVRPSERLLYFRKLTCSSSVPIVAYIEDPNVIEKILAHLDDGEADRAPTQRALPQLGLFS